MGIGGFFCASHPKTLEIKMFFMPYVGICEKYWSHYPKYEESCLFLAIMWAYAEILLISTQILENFGYI